MVSSNMQGNSQAHFNNQLKRWESRYRIQRFVKWLPRILAVGSIVAIALVLLARLQFAVPTTQRTFLAVLTILAAIAGGTGIVLLITRSRIQSAQYFDQQFGLKERVSTALELIEGRIQAHPEITQEQINDAWVNASQVDHRARLPLRSKRRDWLFSAITLVLLVAALLLPDQVLGVEEAPKQNEAVEEAADDLRDITETVATDTNMEDEERDNLLETLEDAQETLDDQQTTTEEAFAVMSEVESALREQAENLREEMEAQQLAESNAAEALAEESNDPEESELPTLEEVLEELKENLENMDSAEQAAAAEGLQEAADALSQTNPELAQTLEDAAEALSSGDTEGAAEALDQALQQLDEAAQQQQQQQESAEAMEGAADQAAQAAGEIAESDQQGGEQQTQSGQGGEPQEGDQGSSGGEPGEGSQAQSGSGAAQPGNQSGGSQSDQSGEGQSSSQSEEGGTQAGSGAGDSEFDGAVEGGANNNGAIDHNNDPDGGGETDYEPIYAPEHLGGEGGDETQLEADESIVEGEFGENPTGASTVPYNEVFGDYEDSANRTLDGGYVPLGMRDVVRDYFSSLAPD